MVMSLRNFPKQKWELYTPQLLVAKPSLCFRLLWEVKCNYRPSTYSDLRSELAETIESDTPTELGVVLLSLICCKAPALSQNPEPEAGGGFWLRAFPSWRPSSSRRVTCDVRRRAGTSCCPCSSTSAGTPPAH